MSLKNPALDRQRLVDGFRGVPLGMDGSKDPILVPEGAMFYGQNVTFRGGSGPRTRPGFKRVIGLPGSLFQGWAVHHSVISGHRSVILAVLGGVVWRYDPFTNILDQISDGSTCMSATDPIYFCQASRFTVLQDGSSEPRVYVSNEAPSQCFKRVSNLGNPALTTGQKIPVGTQMAYGQGRLFVAVKEQDTTPSAIWAGDIAFGGSTSKYSIAKSERQIIETSSVTNTEQAGAPVATATTVNFSVERTKFTTAAPHNFHEGDFVTIESHATLNSINTTYRVIGAPTNFTFEVYADGGSDGAGGYASGFTAGKDTDVLHFTETSFINEGGALTVSSELGRIRSLAFLPVQDTTAGQGDLVAFCERGATSFAVSLPRATWKETVGFQKMLYSGIGIVGESVCPINGDLFFRSLDGNGIRSYRNARAEFNGVGQTPISSEVDPILVRDTPFLLQKDKAIEGVGANTVLGCGVSLINFDNRLLMTCLPRAQTGDGIAHPFITFGGLIAMDFKSISGTMGKTNAVYDGVWTGLEALSLVSGDFIGQRRAFAACFHNSVFEVWEITEDQEFDLGANGKTNILCSVTTRNFDFKDPMELKKLTRADLWFDSISGGPTAALDITLYYRPDSSPQYIEWATWQKCFTTSYTEGVDVIDLITPFAKGYAPQLRTPTPPQTENPVTGVPDNLGYDFGMKCKWVGQGRLTRLMAHAIQVVEKVSGG
jgi:hypothetical protein